MRTQRPETTRTEDIAALAAAAMRGDRSAFDRLHDRLSAGLLRILVDRTGGRTELAEELAQRTWVVVWEAVSSGKYDPSRSAITTFLYAVSHKIWLQHLRTSARRPTVSDQGIPEADSSEESPAGAAGLAELLTAVRECLEGAEQGVAGALEPDERALIRAVASGHSDRALAKMLGLAPSTVNVRKRSVIDKIRRFLAVRGHRGPERDTDSGE